MSILPSVRAELAERYIFNFRLPPVALQKYLPAPWLVPQIVDGYGVASFCVLDLRHITVAPLPTIVGIDSISCAPRYAVHDTTHAESGSAVFVAERQTNSAFGAWFTSLGFSAPHPYVEAAIEHAETQTRVHVNAPTGDTEFAACVEASSASGSLLFPRVEDFADFLAAGIRSYGVSRYENQLTIVDLHKEEPTYSPLRVHDLTGTIVAQWQADGGVLDSAFQTKGGRYEWTYYGLTEAREPVS